MNEIELFNEAHNLQIEIAVGNAIAYKFPHIAHVITLNYDGDNLEITFLDPSQNYSDKVFKFIEELKLTGAL